MTAGMTTQNLESSRVSLPRAGLGALLAATLLAGGLIGAAAYAGIGAAIAQPATVSATLHHESIVVRNLRIAAGRGQLIGDDAATVTIGIGTTGAPAHDGFRHDRAPGATVTAKGVTNVPATGDGFDHGRPNGRATDAAPFTRAPITHAPGRGPLR